GGQRRAGQLALLLALAAGFVGGLAGTWAAGQWGQGNPRLMVPFHPPSPEPVSPAEAIARAVGPSVVGVISTYVREDPATGETTVVGRATGSGVVFDLRGFIVTNHHVVSMIRDGRDVHPREIQVLLANGR